MAVDRNHVPDIIDLDSAGRLCRELHIAGVEPLLTTTSEGYWTTGVALVIDAGAVQKSEAAAAQFRRQAFDALAQGLPLSIAITNPGGVADAADRFRNLCEILRKTVDDAGALPAAVELLIEASSVSPQAAWLMRCELLGEGALYIIAPRSLMRPDDTATKRVATIDSGCSCGICAGAECCGYCAHLSYYRNVPCCRLSRQQL